MAYQYHAKKLRRVGTGGIRKKYRDKKKAHMGGHFIATKIGPVAKNIRHGRGGNKKVALKVAEYANVTISKGQVKKAKIIRVIESPSNREYTRMNIITKGAVIETDAGKARVTSRPGQHGIVNAILIL